MTDLELVGAIVGGIVTIVGGLVGLVRWSVGAILLMLKGHLERVEKSLDSFGTRLASELIDIKAEVSGVKAASEKTADRLESLTVIHEELTPRPFDVSNLSKRNGR